MFKKIIKLIGIIIAGFIVLIIAVAAITGYSAAKYEKTAIPYIENVLPQLSEWDYIKAKEFMASSALQDVEDVELEKLFKWFSKLGSLQGFESPQFINLATGVSTDDGTHTIVTYKILSHYENGDAELTLRLLENNGKFEIYHFNVNSMALIE